MRSLAIFSLGLMICLATGCPKAGGGGQPAANATALPKGWPIAALTIPAGGKVFEGNVDTHGSGPSTDYTVFFTSAQPYDAVRGEVEGKLKPLKYVIIPDDPSAPKTTRTWSSPDGKLIVLLSYEESKDSQEKLGQPGFYTLLVQAMNDPVPVDSTWQKL